MAAAAGDAAGAAGGAASGVGAGAGAGPEVVKHFGGALPALARFEASAREGFLHAVADDLCGRTKDFYRLYPSVTGVKDAVDSYKLFFVRAVNAGFDAAQTAAALGAAGVDASLHAGVHAVLTARADDIREALVEALSTVSAASVADFDWSVRMVLASGTGGAMREAVLVLTLRARGAGGGAGREIYVEMTKDKLGELLGTFGDIAAAVATVEAE